MANAVLFLDATSNLSAVTPAARGASLETAMNDACGLGNGLYCSMLIGDLVPADPSALLRHLRYVQSLPGESLSEPQDWLPWSSYHCLVHPNVEVPRGWRPSVLFPDPTDDRGWTVAETLNVLSLLNDVWPGPLLITDDQHSSIFIQLDRGYLYACSLRGAPQNPRPGQEGAILYATSWSALIPRAMESCLSRRPPEDAAACAFELAWLISPDDPVEALDSDNGPPRKRARHH